MVKVPSTSYKRIKLALFQNYFDVFKNLDIKRSFIVPSFGREWAPEHRDVKLGEYMHKIRTNVRKEGFYREDDLAELLKLGFALNSRHARNKLLLSMFTLYNEKFPEHKCVDKDFIISKDNILWPEKLRGVKLGNIFHNIKYEKHHELIHNDLLALGFDLTYDQITKKIDLAAFESYFQIHDDLLVPSDFVVPRDEENCWPKKYHGFKLGRHVYDIRADVTHEIGRFDNDDVQKLVEMGFAMDANEEHARSILLAFKTFKEKFGHGEIVQSFKISKNDTAWPKETRGVALGACLNDIRCVHSHKSIHNDLIELGVDIGPQIAGHDFERIFKSLSDYKTVHGDLKVPNNFVVPRDAAYSENAWGLKLGQNLQSIRCGGIYSEHRDRLVALGVSFKVKKINAVGFDVIYSALKAYRAVYGDLLVPQKFEVPQGDVRFPVESWGMKLGSNVQNIRNRGTYAKHRAKLEELGFVYKDSKPVVEIV